MATKQRILSGATSTERLHLGNLEGAVRNWVALQDEYECYYFVADWHGLTTINQPGDTDMQREFVRGVAVDCLASGIDPEKSVFFYQSDVKEHAELHLLLSMVTPVPWLERVPTYKEKKDELHLEAASYGLLGYPVLQAADILIYKAHFVPVGKDQLPHIELTREIARRFNWLFATDLLIEPQPKLTKAQVLPGIDGRKMSKSYDNGIYLSDDAETVRKKVSEMFTDPEKIRKTDKGHPDACPVYALHSIYTEDYKKIYEPCSTGDESWGCVQCKKLLAESIIKALEPIWAKRAELIANPKKVDEIMAVGAERARAFASITLAEVREAMKISRE
jgi:tryptophanyl-tRNA synthetase